MTMHYVQILAGMKKRHEKTGEVPILIHTVCTMFSLICSLTSLAESPLLQSGTGTCLLRIISHHVSVLTNSIISRTGVLVDDAKGDKTTDMIYHDSRPEEIESLPDTALHRNVDLLIVGADKAGRCHKYN